jgi:hypothetical protein
MDGGIIVQAVNLIEQFGLGNGFRELEQLTKDAGLQARKQVSNRINLRRVVV